MTVIEFQKHKKLRGNLQMASKTELMDVNQTSNGPSQIIRTTSKGYSVHIFSVENHIFH